jgi:hypothetical protein
VRRSLQIAELSWAVFRPDFQFDAILAKLS